MSRHTWLKAKHCFAHNSTGSIFSILWLSFRDRRPQSALHLSIPISIYGINLCSCYARANETKCPIQAIELYALNNRVRRFFKVFEAQPCADISRWVDYDVIKFSEFGQRLPLPLHSSQFSVDIITYEIYNFCYNNRYVSHITGSEWRHRSKPLYFCIAGKDAGTDLCRLRNPKPNLNPNLTYDVSP